MNSKERAGYALARLRPQTIQHFQSYRYEHGYNYILLQGDTYFSYDFVFKVCLFGLIG